jgi:hypothetical protein
VISMSPHFRPASCAIIVSQALQMCFSTRREDNKFETIRPADDIWDRQTELDKTKKHSMFPELDVRIRKCLCIVRNWFEIPHAEFPWVDSAGSAEDLDNDVTSK